MNFEMFSACIVVGLFTGWLAGSVMKEGSYGRTSDLLLALLGSSGASVLVWVLGISSDAGTFAMAAIVAFAGAAILVIAQRKLWYRTADV